MIFIYISTGILVALLCIFLFLKGVKIGMSLKDGKELKKPLILQTKAEKEQTKADQEEAEKIKKFNDELQDLANYEPQYTSMRK